MPRRGTLGGGQVSVEVSDGFDAAEIIFQGDVFVGSVGVFIRQTKTDEHAGDFESVVHLRDEGDGAAFANKHGAFAKTLFERVLRLFENGRLIRCGPRFAGAKNVEFAMHAFRQKFAYVFFNKLGDFLRILMGNEARRKLRINFGSDHRLRAFALIAAPNAVEFERRTRPQTLHDGEAFFAIIGGSADGAFEIFLFPRQGIESFAFRGSEFAHAVIKTGNGDAKILVVQLGE